MAETDAEEQFLKRARASNEGFAELFDKCYDRVYAYVYRRVHAQQAAEDIAECVFEDALKGIDKLRWEGKPVIAWLYRIASRRIADHYRARDVLPLDEESVQTAGRNSDESLERTERQIEVKMAFEKLSPSQQEIIRLTYFDSLEPAEIAAVLGISQNNVYVRLHRAMERLESVLKAHGG